MDEYVGTGPGAITNDGCAVEFYARLPAFGEAEIVHAAVPPGASVLELGCGTGRILRPLAALGHPVTGVDDSPAMLDRSPDLPGVCAAIETVRLDRAFDVVLLASTLINADPGTRRGFLAATGAVVAQDITKAQDHDHNHQVVPSDPALRVKSLESLLVDKGLVDRAALDAELG